MFAGDPDLGGNENLIDLLKLDPEQTIKCVIKLDLVPIPTRRSVSHARVRLQEKPRSRGSRYR